MSFEHIQEKMGKEERILTSHSYQHENRNIQNYNYDHLLQEGMIVTHPLAIIADSISVLRSRSGSIGKIQTPGRQKKIGLASLVVLAFYTVSGGPFGIEDVVRAGGPFYALMGFTLILVWAIPEALITCELATAMPEASGSVAWVEVAFGDWWAFQKGYLSWLSGVADNALYPILFLDCLLELFADPNGVKALDFEESGTLRWMIIIALTLAGTYLNYRGLDVVTEVAIVICLVSLLPFVIFCILGAPRVDPSNWLISPPGGISGVDWRLLLNSFFWNINYWESVSSFAGEVKNPGVTFPKGIFLAVLLVFLSTFIPVLIGTGASKEPYTEWTDGYFVRLASTIVGPWLSYWMMLGGTLTSIGMFEAEMSSDAWLIAGMAERGILPCCLGRRNMYDTPTYGILLSASGVVLLCWMRFSEVVQLLNLLYCFGQLIEFAAFLELRRSQPNLARPYKIPLEFGALCVMVAFPVLFILVIISFSSSRTLILALVVAIMGIPLHHLLKYYKILRPADFSAPITNHNQAT